MKKFPVYVLVLIIILLAFIFVKLVPDVLLNIGKAAYNQNQYLKAYKVLKPAIRIQPRNRDIRYYYTQTLINLSPVLEVQKELFNISEANISDSAELIAERQIATWKNQISQNIGENYIEQVPFDNRILRWDATKFPLKVNIQNNSKLAPDYYLFEIQNAFLQWQTATNNLVTFNFVDNPQKANILISINSSADMKKCNGADCKYVTAYTTPTIDGNMLKNMTILFYDANNLGQPYTSNEIYNTAIHEIGHTLGIMGHSQNKDNVMYMETNQNDAFTMNQTTRRFISPADLNTLNLLYELIPEITNTPLNEFNTSHQFFAPIVLGGKNQIVSRKIMEAQNYIKSAPDLPNGYIDLAIGLTEENKNNAAMEALDKALMLCNNDSEKFIVYYNYAIIYSNIKDWNNALAYANMAKELNTTSDTNGLIAMINYSMGNKKQAKEAYMEAINKEPGNIINSYNLAIIYMKEFNFVKAGKVLNNLVKANPEAKTDPRIKPFTLLMFLFS